MFWFGLNDGAVFRMLRPVLSWLFGALEEALFKIGRYLSQMAFEVRQRRDPFANP